MSDNKNSLILSVQFIFAVIVSFIVLKLNILSFGSELFGIWINFSALWGLAMTLDLGFGFSIIRYVALAKEENDNYKLSSIISNSIFVFVLLGILILIIGLLLGYFIYFTNSKLVPIKNYSTAIIVFILLSTNFFIQYISNVIKSIFEGINKFSLIAFLLIINNFLILVSAVIVYSLNLSIIYLAIFYCISSLAYSILITISFNKFFKDINVSYKYLNKKQISDIFNFSYKIQITFLLNSFLDPIIKYLIGNFSSLSTITMYEIARKFSLAISSLFVASFRNIVPKISLLKNKEEYKNLFYSEGVRIINFGVFYSGILFGVFAIVFALIIKLWFGVEEAIYIFLLLALAESINNYGYFNYMFFLTTGKAHYLTIISLSNIILTTAGLFIGFNLFHNYNGLSGYYISVLLANILLIYFVVKDKIVSLNYFFNDILTKKLFLFNILLVIAVLFLFYSKYSLFTSLVILSLLSLTLFIRDINKYYKTLLNIFLKR